MEIQSLIAVGVVAFFSVLFMMYGLYITVTSNDEKVKDVGIIIIIATFILIASAILIIIRNG